MTSIVLVLFQSSHAQNLTVLHMFTGGNDGGSPYGELVFDTSGNLYGTTGEAGKYGAGVVFKLKPNDKEVVLHQFTGMKNGGNPYFGSLTMDTAGNLYGTTSSGGRFGVGTVFELSAKRGEKVLYSFGTTGGDGENPLGSVIRDGAGNLYGTTYIGGNYNCNPPLGCGVVFKIDPTGKETILHAFDGAPDGAQPQRGLLLDSQGNLYGTTFEGGTGVCDIHPTCGTVFRIDAEGNETIVHNFSGYPTDGANPDSNLISDSAGNLYGTTSFGGTHDWGTIFKINPHGKEKVLYNFAGYSKQDGASPSGPLIRDAAGNLYGTTWSGGVVGDGTIFKLDRSGKETVLHSFSYSDGAFPYSGLVLDSAGNLYGTTSGGGTGNCKSGYNCGLIFKLSPN